MISIIIPVYNVEKYLDECMRSVVGQTYSDLEIILVDDGSTDLSGSICDSWAEKDGRVKAYHKPNGGVMSAWKYGFERSSGEYIGFADPDDWIDLDMYERLLAVAEADGADITLCGLIFDYGCNKAPEPEKTYLKKLEYSREDIVNEIYPCALWQGGSFDRGISANRVTKLFRREIISQALPFCADDVSIGDDFLAVFASLITCEKISVVHGFYPYHYRIHGMSMIHKYSDAKYGKIRALKRALDAVDVTTDGYFSAQIANNYISLILQTMEQEILDSGYTNKKIKSDLKSEINEPIFRETVKKCDISSMPLKAKIYLALLRMHLFGGMIALRKVKKVK